MSYRFLDHATDAIIEITAKNIKEAFAVTADAVINITLDQDKVEEKEQKQTMDHCTYSRNTGDHSWRCPFCKCLYQFSI